MTMTTAKILAEKCAEAEISKQADDGFLDRAIGAAKGFASDVSDKYNTDSAFKAQVHGAGLGALALGTAGGIYGAARGRTRTSPSMSGKQKARIYASEILRGIVAGAAVGGAAGAFTLSDKKDPASEKQDKIRDARSKASPTEASAIDRRVAHIDNKLTPRGHIAVLGRGLYSSFNEAVTPATGAALGASIQTARDIQKAPVGTSVFDATSQGHGLHRLRRMVADRGRGFGWRSNSAHQNAYLRSIGVPNHDAAVGLGEQLRGATPQQAQAIVRNRIAKPAQQAYLASDAYTVPRARTQHALRHANNLEQAAVLRGASGAELHNARQAVVAAQAEIDRFGSAARTELRGRVGNFNIGVDPHIGAPAKVKADAKAPARPAPAGPGFVPARAMATRMAVASRIGGGAAKGAITAVVLDGLMRYLSAVSQSGRVVR